MALALEIAAARPRCPLMDAQIGMGAPCRARLDYDRKRNRWSCPVHDCVVLSGEAAVKEMSAARA